MFFLRKKITYKTKCGFIYANKNNSKYFQCNHDARKIYCSLKRNCPVCGCEINYKNRNGYIIALKRNSKCKKCFHPKIYTSLERKCPKCEK